MKIQKTLALLLVMLLSQIAHPALADDSIDRIVATVNETVVTQSELDKSMSTAKKQILASRVSLPPEDILRKQVLDQLINRKLQLQLAEQANINATEEDIDRAVNQIAHDNGISPQFLYKKVALQGGMTRDEYRKELHEEITIQKMQQQELMGKINVVPQEIDDFMRSKSWQVYNGKEYHLEDLLVGLPDEPTSEQIQKAKKQAEDLVNRIHKGMNFRQAATAESSTNALKGGDLGWRKLPEMPTVFVDQVVQMKPNDVVGPIQAPNGFHILHLAGIRDNKEKVSDTDQRKKVTQLIQQRKFEEALQNWILKIRGAAIINLNPEKPV